MKVPQFYFALTDRLLETYDEFLQKPLEGADVLPKPLDFIPKQATPTDTGYDVRCADKDGLTLVPGAYFKMSLGFRMFAPFGWWLHLVPRSGTFLNLNIHALYGTIDETYEGEMCFVGQYLPDSSKLHHVDDIINIKFGQRVAQVYPSIRYEMGTNIITNPELNLLYQQRNASRKTGGFNSTGDK